MKRTAHPRLSEDGQHALDPYTQMLQLVEDLSPVTIGNSLSDLRSLLSALIGEEKDSNHGHAL